MITYFKGVFCWWFDFVVNTCIGLPFCYRYMVGVYGLCRLGSIFVSVSFRAGFVWVFNWAWFAMCPSCWQIKHVRSSVVVNILYVLFSIVIVKEFGIWHFLGQGRLVF